MDICQLNEIFNFESLKQYINFLPAYSAKSPSSPTISNSCSPIDQYSQCSQSIQSRQSYHSQSNCKLFLIFIYFSVKIKFKNTPSY